MPTFKDLNVYKIFFFNVFSCFIKRNMIWRQSRKGPQVWAKADRNRMHQTVETLLTAASRWRSVRSPRSKDKNKKVSVSSDVATKSKAKVCKQKNKIRRGEKKNSSWFQNRDDKKIEIQKSRSCDVYFPFIFFCLFVCFVFLHFFFVLVFGKWASVLPAERKLNKVWQTQTIEN